MNDPNPRAREWNAASYDRLGTPLTARGIAVVDRLELSGDEVVLDAGCGTGRVTATVLERLPHGRVVALDGSEAMVTETAALLGEDPRVRVLRADLTEELPFDDAAFDAILSTSTLHWVHDHPAVFARFARVLRGGGRLEIDCGGEGNVSRLEAAVRAAGVDWSPWNFRGPDEARTALERVGFDQISAWLSPDPVQVAPESLHEYLRTVMLGSHLARLSSADGDALVDAVAAALPDGLIEYVRLNISATRAPRTGEMPGPAAG